MKVDQCPEGSTIRGNILQNYTRTIDSDKIRPRNFKDNANFTLENLYTDHSTC